MEFTVDSLLALLTLTGMETVLGIDNIVFIAILVGRLPKAEQARTRQLGIGLALGMRMVLLFSISWIMSLTAPFFELFSKGFSGRDLILIAGGMFLIFKATHEIHAKLEGPDVEDELKRENASSSLAGRKSGQSKLVSKSGVILFQILLLDIVFSLDSVITAVGMAQQISIMVIAMVLSVGIMLIAAGGITRFVEKHPTVKILALSFLLLIGVMLIVEGMGGHIAKGYIYFAMAFSLAVELINIQHRKRNGV